MLEVLSVFLFFFVVGKFAGKYVSGFREAGRR